MSEEIEEDDPAAATLDPPFPYRIVPLDWNWVRAASAGQGDSTSGIPRGSDE